MQHDFSAVKMCWSFRYFSKLYCTDSLVPRLEKLGNCFADKNMAKLMHFSHLFLAGDEISRNKAPEVSNVFMHISS